MTFCPSRTTSVTTATMLSVISLKSMYALAIGAAMGTVRSTMSVMRTARLSVRCQPPGAGLARDLWADDDQSAVARPDVETPIAGDDAALALATAGIPDRCPRQRLRIELDQFALNGDAPWLAIKERHRHLCCSSDHPSLGQAEAIDSTTVVSHDPDR